MFTFDNTGKRNRNYIYWKTTSK